MSAPGLFTCSFSAYHRDFAPHVFYCEFLPGHEGKHGHQIAAGIWLNWDVTVGFDAAPPPNPADWSEIGVNAGGGRVFMRPLQADGVVDADGRVLQGELVSPPEPDITTEAP